MKIINQDKVTQVTHVINSLAYQGDQNPMVAMDHLNEINRFVQESLQDIYKEYPDWFVRVLQEFIELNDKIHKLYEFISKDKPETMEDSQWELLKQQLRCMEEYRFILENRIRDTGLFSDYGF